MDNNSKEHLKKLVGELCEQGEDKDELTLWVNLYDGLVESEQIALITNLEKELSELKGLKS